jgi:hypothetical protein
MPLMDRSVTLLNKLPWPAEQMHYDDCMGNIAVL